VATPSEGRFDELFAEHRTATIPSLWPWQREVLTAFEGSHGDVAIDLPTGTGKTLVGLLIGEDFRRVSNRPVAYLAGNKALAKQVEREARLHGMPIVRLQGSKDTWSKPDVRAFNYGQAIGVMNYWNYFNASPGVDAAGMLILDDVHLLEQPLRDMYTVSVPFGEDVYGALLSVIVAECPYYTLAQDLLNGVTPPGPPEMIVFPDSADLAAEVRAILDARLEEGSATWWAWQQVRDHVEVCCWLVSARALTITPYLPPTQTYPHFADPAKRVYMSATIGTVEDLRRRIGAPPLERITAAVKPRQGERFVVVWSEGEHLSVDETVGRVRQFVQAHKKALWLSARRATASELVAALTQDAGFGPVRFLEADNGADERFASDEVGQLVTAGRYDGMDFPDDICRVEVLPEVPVVTSDLEEWTTTYLRDAGFAEARFAQRLAQALGRCNRSEDDRAVYFLMDPEFATRLGQRRTLDALPDEARIDSHAGLIRSDEGWEAALDQAARFLQGEDFTSTPPPGRMAAVDEAGTVDEELAGMLDLWSEDFGQAAARFDRVAASLAAKPEHRALWLAMRSMALQLAARYGDEAAGTEALVALRAAATAGARTTFFTRLRLSESRRAGRGVTRDESDLDPLFTAWDGLLRTYGATGPRLERWAKALVTETQADDHDTVARSIAKVGRHLLGLASEAPQATAGEHDAAWELPQPPRTLTFEVKLAPTTKKVVNSDVEQAEGATRSVATRTGRSALGLLLTPWREADATAVQRLDRVRLICRDDFVAEVEYLVGLLKEYRRGWEDESATRAARRGAVEDRVPVLDWLWRAASTGAAWVTAADMAKARR
jgi:hypothetical protein